MRKYLIILFIFLLAAISSQAQYNIYKKGAVVQIISGALDTLEIVGDSICIKNSNCVLLPTSPGGSDSLYINGDSLCIDGGNCIYLPSGGGSSNWQIVSNTYLPIDTTANFRFTASTRSLVNDSVSLLSENIPFVGGYQIKPSYTNLSGILDLSSMEGPTYTISGGFSSTGDIIGYVTDLDSQSLFILGDKATFVLKNVLTVGSDNILQLSAENYTQITSENSLLIFADSVTITSDNYTNIQSAKTLNLAAQGNSIKSDSTALEIKSGSGIPLIIKPRNVLPGVGTFLYCPNGFTGEIGFTSLVISGNVSPIGIVPNFPGQMYINTALSELYISVGFTNSDWIKVN